MEIDAFKEVKRQMESEIRSAVCAAVAKFRDATGYTPAAIYVHMIDKTLVGDSTPQYVVGQVRAQVEL
jgi:hypothetical protein